MRCPSRYTVIYLAVVGLGLGFFRSSSRAQEHPPSGWSPTQAEGWKPVDLGDLSVKPGSALDFSYLVEDGPAGKHGFVRISDKGELVFEKQPDKPLRFFTTADPMEYWLPETPEDIAAFAEQVRLGGYNCFRTHYLDLMLMINTSTDLVPNPKQLARWDLLGAELKKRGIYLYVDLATTWMAYYKTAIKGTAWTPEGRAHNLGGRMYWKDPEAREHWEKGVKFLLEHVNPHTGLALKDEPQVIVFELRNEAGLHFLLEYSNKNKQEENGLIGPFRAWLEHKYRTITALNDAWPGLHYHAFTDIPFPARKGISPPTQDLERFILETEIETVGWMKGVVQKVGVRVPVQDLNAGVAFSGSLSRSTLPMVEQHSYHDHPTNYVTAGSTDTNLSSAGQGFPFVTWTNEVRQLGRPFLVTEWGYPYWNQWRYESGLSAPAYGALQGWQMLLQAHEAVKDHTAVPPRPFKIANDPPNRLGDRMAAFFFARGDVAPSPHTVEIRLDPQGVFTRLGAEGYMPTALRRLTLLVGNGLRIVDFPSALPGASVKADASLRIHPTAKALVWTDDPNAAETPNETQVIAKLRARGILPAGNRTNASEGIYQSDTGQLTLDTKRKIMTVNTPCSQAASLPEGSGEVRLADVTFQNGGSSGSFFVGSLDRKPLVESRRMLILAVGDALNSGATFTNESRQVLQSLGTFPILVKPIKAEIELKRSLAQGETVRLRALAFNGDPLEEIPVKAGADGLHVSIDTSTMANPVFQYELVIEGKGGTMQP